MSSAPAFAAGVRVCGSSPARAGAALAGGAGFACAAPDCAAALDCALLDCDAALACGAALVRSAGLGSATLAWQAAARRSAAGTKTERTRQGCFIGAESIAR